MSTHSILLRDSSFLTRILQQYLLLLNNYPVLTKSVTSGVLSALGNLLSQVLENKRNNKHNSSDKTFRFLEVVHFAFFGFVVTGPASHYFYQLLELVLPSSAPFSLVKRLLLERLVFAPAFLLLFFAVINALEGKTLADLKKKLSVSYWSSMKMNWRVWTPIQFININYVPVQFRVLFANVVALFWYAYLASVRRST